MRSLGRGAILLLVLVFAAGTSFAAPLILKHDDGSGELAFGLTGDGDLWWANSFSTSGSLDIIGLQVQFIEFDEDNDPTGINTTDSLDLLLYNDPDDDGNPDDAVLLQQVATTVQSLDVYNGVTIPETTVTGTFFVAALMQQDGAGDPLPNQFPAARDTDGDAIYSWVGAASPKGTIDPDDLSGTLQVLVNFDAIGRTGVFMLRAVAVPEPGTLMLLGLGGILTAVGFRRRRRVRA